jgi:predicted  nucleic acid-binding Zn-ribbon protein
MRGAGDVTFTCGGCRAVVYENLESPTQVRNMVVKRPTCGTYSETWEFN